MNTSDARELRRASLRLAVQFAALILILFTILIAVTFAIVRASQTEDTNDTLANAGMIDSPHDAPRNVSVAIVDDRRTMVSGGAPSWFPDTSLLKAAEAAHHPILSTKTVGGRTYAIRTDADRGRVVQAAIDTGENSEEIGRLATGLIGAGILAVIGAGFIAAFMARRTMRPMVNALALQRRFVADASHELRTPLTLLSTRAQLLRRHGADPAAIAGLDEILQDARDLTAILEDLLIAADPRESAEKHDLDITDLADHVVARLQPESDTRGLVLSRTGAGTAVQVVGAETALRRMLTALVSNALDHARTSVTVEVRSTNRFAEIRTIDDGNGFAEDLRPRAFDRFATARRSDDTSAGARHYGIGLALVAEVASLHDGTVAIEPTEGAGACVVVRLPLARE